MGIFSPSTFLAKLQGGGALQSLFQVTITVPTALGAGTTASDDYPYMTKGATFPESTITATPVSYMGREIQIPGNRESTQWVNTVYNDEDFLVRHMLEDWTQKLNSGVGNTRATNWTIPSVYSGTLKVIGYKKSTTPPDQGVTDSTEVPEVASIYKFVNAWPSSIGEVTLDWETNEIQEYEVTWEYAFWTRETVI
jgi:hypothetical protein